MNAQPDLSTNALGQPLGLPVPDWKPCDWPSREAMLGRFCRVEPLEVETHGDDLHAAFLLDSEGANWTYLPYGPFPEKGPFLEWLHKQADGKDPFFHAYIDLATEKVVGMGSLMRINPAAGSIETGHLHFSPLMQRSPISTEAMFLKMCRAFDELGYRRYEWKCNDLNAASKNAALRLGFTAEGVHRQAGVVKGYNRDTAWFSILDSEWPAVKAGFQDWLAPENFDAEGQQRNRLQDLMAKHRQG